MSETKYVEHVLDIIESTWLRAIEIDWPSFRLRHLALAARSSCESALHDVVDRILAELDDGHSHLVRPSAMIANSPRQPPSLICDLRDGVGYIDVPWFAESSGLSGEDFAAQIQCMIATLDGARPCGWIIDLRRNGGGNMWPMLAGLGPLIGSGVIGSFVAQGRVIGWSYKDGAACNGERVLCRAAGEPHVMGEPVARTAILMGSRTASAGEAVCIAFKGRPSTRFFGVPTAGQSTGNESVLLEDGAVLAIVAAVMVDRLGRIYGGQVMPDVSVPISVMAQDQDAALGNALAWLKQAGVKKPH